jgi:hypothetical protein
MQSLRYAPRNAALIRNTKNQYLLAVEHSHRQPRYYLIYVYGSRLRRSGLLSCPIDELDNRQLRCITVPDTGANDTGVSPVTCLTTRANICKQLVNNGLTGEIPVRLTTRIECVVLPESNQFLDHRTELLRLLNGGLETLVLDERRSKVAQKRTAMTRIPAELS